jgi:sporulation protein YlmC with PRC-barrel domain
MEDLGEPISYLTLSKGAAVYSSDGEHLGRVTRVLADPDSDVFDGLVFDINAARPGGHRFVDAPEVDRIFERGVVLKIDAAEAGELPEPSANPGSLSIKPGDLGRGGGGGGAMRRLWDRLSGKG